MLQQTEPQKNTLLEKIEAASEKTEISNTAPSANIDPQLRQEIIRTLAQNKNYEQLAKYLDAAFWHWQDECLTLTLQDPQVEQSLRDNSSLLLRFFQKALAPKYSIVKLSLALEAPTPKVTAPKAEQGSKVAEELPLEIQLLQRVFKATLKVQALGAEDIKNSGGSA